MTSSNDQAPGEELQAAREDAAADLVHHLRWARERFGVDAADESLRVIIAAAHAMSIP